MIWKKVKSKSLKVVFGMLMLIFSTYLMAQSPPPPPEPSPTDSPLDGGLSVLIAGAVGYGLKKVNDGRKKNRRKDEDMAE